MEEINGDSGPTSRLQIA